MAMGELPEVDHCELKWEFDHTNCVLEKLILHASKLISKEGSLKQGMKNKILCL